MEQELLFFLEHMSSHSGSWWFRVAQTFSVLCISVLWIIVCSCPFSPLYCLSVCLSVCLFGLRLLISSLVSSKFLINVTRYYANWRLITKIDRGYNIQIFIIKYLQFIERTDRQRMWYVISFCKNVDNRLEEQIILSNYYRRNSSYVKMEGLSITL